MVEVKFKKNLSIGELTDLILNSSKQYETFIKVPTNKKSLVFLNLPVHIQEIFAKRMRISRIIKILKYIDEDDIVEFLQPFTEKKRKRILNEFQTSQKKVVEYLLKFDPETAASLMSLNFITTRENYNIEKLKNKIKRIIKDKKEAPLVLLVDESNKFNGYIPITTFILDTPTEIIKEAKPLPIVRFDEDYEEVLDLIREENYDYVVVTDYEDAILGYVEVGNLLRAEEKRTQEEIYKLAGVQKEEDILDGAKFKIKSRSFWLLINLFTAFLAAGVIGLFEDTLSKFVLLAVYLPIIAGMGGNAATQTLTVVIRGMVLHEIDRKRKISILIQEVIAGLANGAITGIVVGIVAYLWNGLALLGLIVFLSMIANLIIAAFFGTLVPFLLKKYKIDPAVAGTVLVTTATDVLGFFVFLGLAELMLF